MLTRSKKSMKGFTLIEMVVVLGIMGVITAVAVPKYLGVKEQAKENACHQSENLIAHELYTMYMMDNKLMVDGQSTIDANGKISTDNLENLGLKSKCPDGQDYYTAKIEFEDNDLKVSVSCSNPKHGGTNNQNIVLSKKILDNGIVKNFVSAYSQDERNNHKYIDSVIAKDEERIPELSEYVNIGKDVSYWNLSNNDSSGNEAVNNRLYWTTADVDLTKIGATYYVPTYTYGYKDNDFKGVYAVFMSKIEVINDGNVKFTRLGTECEITNTGDLDNKKDFNYVSDFYDKAVEEWKNYNGTIKSDSDATKFTTYVKDKIKNNK